MDLRIVVERQSTRKRLPAEAFAKGTEVGWSSSLGRDHEVVRPGDAAATGAQSEAFGVRQWRRPDVERPRGLGRPPFTVVRSRRIPSGTRKPSLTSNVSTSAVVAAGGSHSRNSKAASPPARPTYRC